MKTLIDELLRKAGNASSRPSAVADIEAVAAALGEPIPSGLLELWRRADGVRLECLDANLLGASAVRELLTGDSFLKDEFLADGFIPILDDNQSNFLVLAARSPLAHRVLHIPHDSDKRVVYRTLDTCLADLMRTLDMENSADLYLHDAPGDYEPDVPRPEADQLAAKALLLTNNARHEWNLAVQLLDASNVSEWTRLLETDHFVRRDVRARMAKMSSPAIAELLREDDDAFEQFAVAVEEAVQQAGLASRRRNRTVLEIDSQDSAASLKRDRKLMNLDAFFYRRNIPDALPRLVAWFQDALVGQNPHKRQDHFFAD